MSGIKEMVKEQEAWVRGRREAFWYYMSNVIGSSLAYSESMRKLAYSRPLLTVFTCTHYTVYNLYRIHSLAF